jgi:thiol-disulfide isomerase/thioredoxin
MAALTAGESSKPRSLFMQASQLRRFALGIALAAAIPLSSLAQDKPDLPAAAPQATLKVGDKAPPVAVEKWVKGTPVKSFESGRTYVVEFWSTWCGPCIAVMPHVSELQAKYKDKVTFIGVNIWEDDEYSDTTFPKVEKFVEKQGDKMAYTVAYDGKAKATDTAYMKAALRNGIPSAFIVNGEGKVAWIGHPGRIDEPLEQVVAGKFDMKAAAELAAKEQEQARAMMALRGEVVKFRGMLDKSEYEEAYKLGGKLVDDAIASKNAQMLNEIAWFIVDPEGTVGKRDLDLAMKAAVKADEFSGGKDAAIIDTVARVHFRKGDVKKAVELQTKAVELASGPMKEQLTAALDEYKKKLDKKD